jgi:hypothetical protein
MEGFVPAALICQPDRDIVAAETDLPDEDNPLCGKVNHWEGRNCPDGEFAEAKPGKYASVPLCTRSQWEEITPMIATHYGTDKWFSRRAELAGFPIIATESMLLYHFAASEGRAPRYDGWLHSDLLAYDMNIAYPRYIAGELVPTELPETRGTAAGREEARDFLRRSGL